MRAKEATWALCLVAGGVVAAVAACSPAPPADAPPTAATAPAAEDEVLLCDGETKVKIDANKPMTRANGQAVAAALMEQWLEKNPDAGWEAAERERHTLEPSADNSALVGRGQGHTYGAVTEEDVARWKRETERIALAGSAVFHSADDLGSTIAVSCDMCHPHAANTHPETYPKFQRQLGRVVLLRDMINWCIEHPVRGKPLDAEDPRMRALEAYMYAQRRGAALDYGKL
jgi:thiosulfate dehydrogenase